ncbi:unnamed protein product [Brugia pahangi]|uniref:DPPIV_N domain-containing protein n=1 Tax=Brugia pahangi TaxID=6280 RepID=A0A0N4TJY4_BRUPA|nr:unnamed protein product [Brugia pahangi]
MYYLGIVLEISDSRIKVLRKTKIYQFNCEIPTNVVPGSWINFSFNDDSMAPFIEACSPVLPTKIVKLYDSDGSISSRISIQTIAATPHRENLDDTLEQYVWSPHFEWILDDNGIFNHENVMPDIIYVTWIELLTEPYMSNNVLMKVTEIIRPAYNQLPIYDAPWIGSEMLADAKLLSVHCLKNLSKNKTNPAAIYSGLVIRRDIDCQGIEQVVLWSAATGTVYFCHQQCQNISIGAWIDFVVQNGRGGILEAHKLKYSKTQMMLTRVVDGKAQICQKVKVPENLPKKDWIWISDVAGKIWVDLEHFKKSVMNRWNEFAGNITYVWLSYDQFGSTVCWKFHSIAEPNQYIETKGDALNNERFADLTIL